MTHPQLVELLFAVLCLQSLLTLLSGVPVVHIPLFKGLPDMVDCNLSPTTDCTLKTTMPQKTSLNLCILFVNTSLALLSAALFVLYLK